MSTEAHSIGASLANQNPASRAHLDPVSTQTAPPPPQPPETLYPCARMLESDCNLNRTPGFGKRGCRPTLLGCTARRRFSIHLSRSAADRQEKHLLPDDVVTCGGQKGPCHRGEEHGQAGHDQGPLRLGGASATGSAAQPQGGRTKRRMTPSFRVCGRCAETTVPGTGRWPSPALPGAWSWLLTLASSPLPRRPLVVTRGPF